MRRGMLVVTAVLAVTLLPVAGAGAQSDAATPVVEAARQVTTNPAAVRAHATPAVAVHPDDDRIVAVAEADGYSAACSLHVSTDGGLSWATAAIEQTEDYPKCVYSNFGPIVDVAFGPDGTLYYAYSGFDPDSYHSRIFLARSDNLGGTFRTTALPWVEPDLGNGQFGADALPQIAVDPQRPERIAVGWMTNNGTWNLSDAVREGKRYYYDIFSRPYVAVSEDGGASFGPAVDAAGDLGDGEESRGWMNEPHLVFGNDGELFAFFGENVRPLPEGSEEPAPPAHLWLATSRDGGTTFTQEAIHTRPRKERDWLGQPSPGIDRESGALYVVWDDQSEGPSRVAFMRSEDGGRTWSEPVAVNDVEAPREWNFCEFCPAMDVAPDGRIDVAWYDWRDDAAFDPEEEENRFQQVYYASSSDGGRTWSRNVKVTDRAIDRSIGVADSMGLKGQVGIASTPSAAFVAWDDSRNGNAETHSQDIYLTRVRTGGQQQEATATSGLWWGLGGAGTALAFGGLALVVGAGRAGRLRKRP